MFAVLMLFPAAGSQAQGINLSKLPPQDALDFGITVGDLEVVKSAVARGGRLNNGAKVPLCQAIAGATGTAEFYEGISSINGGKQPSRESYLKIIRWMLQNGADPNILPDDALENPPLLTAARNRDLEIVTLLLDSKANPNINNQNGDTALHELAGDPVALPLPYEKGPRIAELLISRGARSTKNDQGLTPLALAKEMLRIIEDNESYTSLPFYKSLVQSYRDFTEIAAKL
jgi:hypothetical protein